MNRKWLIGLILALVCSVSAFSLIDNSISYNELEGNIIDDVGDVVTRTTRGGDPGVRITRQGGSIIDITPKRVKEFKPNTHPNAPPGTMQKVKFPNSLPGTKGFKRIPTADELKLLESLTQ